MKKPVELARAADPLLRQLMGQIRHFAIELTEGVLWRLRGYDEVDEAPRANVFTGIGFYSRPSSSGSPECIAVGDARAPVVVATRDEKTRAAVAQLEQDETATFNSQTIFKHRANGKCEARSVGGVAEPLSTHDDLVRFKAALDSVAGANPQLTALKTALEALIPAWPAGTKKFEAE